ncbi:hypothetical protein E1B28_002323 [Marasmius oreades]|uniref:RING-type domain-containing protein n=1 Tax=Marasmius oreades TaxID=181124 RepID=A0A9P7RNC4_9AGAR|nr:uncharacterized protein E1B28_002323 [Marasmius oreades]KAG7086363.1 hypothetical protein E1B28_002323 [Marasmius oreades]
MLLLICDICQEELSIDKFLFQSSCGHGFCTTCTDATKSRETCPLCRKPKLKNVPPHRVYLTPSTSRIEDHATSLTNSLSILDSGSTPKQFRKVSSKLRTIANSKALGNSDIAVQLLASAKNMEERLQYIPHQLQLERDEKVALQRKVDLWHARIQMVESQERQIKCLKATIRESNQNVARLQSEINKLTVCADGLRKEQEKLQKVSDQQKKTIAEKEVRLSDLQLQVEDREKKNRLLKQKLKAVSKSTRPPADGNESLFIDSSNTGH